MPAQYSLLEHSYDASRTRALEEFRAAQAKAGGGCDPFAAPPADGVEVRGTFEQMPALLVPEALKALKGAKHGSVFINLRRPNVDEKLRGARDVLASAEPLWWINSALSAGIKVIHYTVNLRERTLGFAW